jgi:HlyD family secretion protein
VWKLGSTGELESQIVQTGISDGLATEVVNGSLREGDTVVVGVDSQRGERRTGDLPPGFGSGQRRPGRDRGL